MAVYYFANGNPTQQVDRLWKIMRHGIAGDVKVDEFDAVYTNVHGNDHHNAKDADIADQFYSLASDFYEVRGTPRGVVAAV